MSWEDARLMNPRKPSNPHPSLPFGPHRATTPPRPEGPRVTSPDPIVSADRLRELLASGEDVVILDARGKRADYDAGHLEGARHADPNSRLSSAADPDADPAAGGRHPLPSLEAWRQTLGSWGVSPASFVVAYDDQAGAN